MEILLLVALATASMSYTITQTSIFKGLRELISKINPFFEDLVHCPWCLGHYISLVWLFIFHKQIIFYDVNVILHFIFDWFVVMGIVGLLLYILLRALAPIAESLLKRQLDRDFK